MQSYLVYKILGSLAALASACAWAFSTILFKKLGDEISALSMNFWKCVMGVLYLGVMLLCFPAGLMDKQTFLFLGLSGLLGIALGDTFYFKALIYLGPRLTVLLATLSPVVTVVLALIFLKESLSFGRGIGIFLTLSGIAWVLWEGSPQEKISRNWLGGIKYALLSVFCMAVAIIFAKVGVRTSSPLPSTFIRLAWSAVGLTIWGFASSQLKNWLALFKNPRLLKSLLFAVFIAVFGGFWLFLFALKYIDASVATVLNSTTPLFILPLTAFILKERISVTAICAAAMAVIGIALVLRA